MNHAASTPATITEDDVMDAVLRAAERVGFSFKRITVGVQGRRVEIAFGGCRTLFSSEITAVRTLDNLAKIAVIGAIHQLEQK